MEAEVKQPSVQPNISMSSTPFFVIGFIEKGDAFLFKRVPSPFYLKLVRACPDTKEFAVQKEEKLIGLPEPPRMGFGQGKMLW